MVCQYDLMIIRKQLTVLGQPVCVLYFAPTCLGCCISLHAGVTSSRIGQA